MNRLIILLLIPIYSYSQSRFEPIHSTILPLSEGKNVFLQYSRTSGPSNYDSLFNLSKLDIEILNENFNRVKKLQSTGCCLNGIKIKNLKRYAYQYIGVVIKGQKHIYINAFSIDDMIEGNDEWKTKSVLVFDGGSSCWGVLFNIETKKFYDLSINGLA